MFSENSEEKKSIENQAEEEKLSPDPADEDVHEGSALPVRAEGEQESVEMT